MLSQKSADSTRLLQTANGKPTNDAIPSFSKAGLLVLCLLL